jgi:hypothetical protein
MSTSRAEYYREYRKRKKTEIGSTESEFTVTALHDVVAELRDVVQQMQQVAQQMQQIAQQILQQTQQSSKELSGYNAMGFSAGVLDMVAQQVQQSVAQQGDFSEEPKRKGSFPPSFPPSHPPQTPPYSSPLLSPQPPKEKPRADFSISSGEEPGATSPDELVDNPDAPLIAQGRGQQRDIATWAELQEAAKFVWEETQSDSLQNAFFDWIEYKHGRGAKEFYTRKGLVAEGKHFVRRHFEDFNVVRAVERAIASNWQGWDHK